MEKAVFAWDSGKDAANQEKHGISFALAQHAFLDESRVIAVDEKHQADEPSFFAWARLVTTF